MVSASNIVSINKKTYDAKNSIIVYVNGTLSRSCEDPPLALFRQGSNPHGIWATIFRLVKNDLLPAILDVKRVEEVMNREQSYLSESKLFKKNMMFSQALSNLNLVSTNVLNFANCLLNPNGVFVRMILDDYPTLPSDTGKEYFRETRTKTPIGLEFINVGDMMMGSPRHQNISTTKNSTVHQGKYFDENEC